MNRNTYIIIVSSLLLLGGLLRFWQLGSLPKTLNPDEAANAYNGYLLAKTGMDEWGRRWPLALQSFGDYKLIGYPALLSLLFAFLPLSDLAVRLPAALAGSTLPLFVLWWLRRLGYGKKTQLVGCMFMVFTPVFIFYSRVAFEALLGLLLFLCSISLLFARTKNRFLFDTLATIFALLAALTYNTPLLLIPTLVVLLPIQRGLLQIKKWILPVVLLSIVFLLLFSELSALTGQKSAITIFRDEYHREQSTLFLSDAPAFIRVFSHPYAYYLNVMGVALVKSFTPNFLVFRGGAHPWHALPQHAHLTIPLYMLAICGVIISALTSIKKILRTSWQSFVRNGLQDTSEMHTVLIYLLGVGVLPAIVTVDAPHATRSLLFFFFLVVNAAIGYDYAFYLIRTSFPKSLLARSAKPIFLLTICLATFLYLYDYFFIFPLRQPIQLPVGFDQAIMKVSEENPEEPIAVVDPDGTWYILTSWYLQISPEQYFDTIIRQDANSFGFRYGERVGRFHFISRASDPRNETILLNRLDSGWVISK